MRPEGVGEADQPAGGGARRRGGPLGEPTRFKKAALGGRELRQAALRDGRLGAMS